MCNQASLLQCSTVLHSTTKFETLWPVPLGHFFSDKQFITLLNTHFLLTQSLISSTSKNWESPWMFSGHTSSPGHFYFSVFCIPQTMGDICKSEFPSFWVPVFFSHEPLAVLFDTAIIHYSRWSFLQQHSASYVYLLDALRHRKHIKTSRWPIRDSWDKQKCTAAAFL